jgi:hypothetical protein
MAEGLKRFMIKEKKKSIRDSEVVQLVQKESARVRLFTNVLKSQRKSIAKSCNGHFFREQNYKSDPEVN